ncbi:MAG TPA: WD40 repeat domain-containing protein, partial [Planctomycetaceae bacterium]|nr:WD40 repeat domain-containing protein [Planctomycetaceae bacterium]
MSTFLQRSGVSVLSFALVAGAAAGQERHSEQPAGGGELPAASEPLYYETTSTALRAVEEHVRSLAFSPDGTRLAVGHGRWDTSGTVRVWDLTTNREIKSWTLVRGVASVVISPDGQWLAYCAWDNRLRILDLATLEPRHDAHIGPRIARLAFSPDSRQLAYASEDGVLKTLDPATGKELRSFGNELHRLQWVAFSGDGQRLAVGGGSFENPSFGRVTVFNAATGEQISTIGNDLKRPVMSLAWSPDGTALLTSSNDAVARVWDAASGELKKTLGGHRSGLEASDVSPDGQIGLTSSGDGTIRLWHVESGNTLAAFAAHQGGAIAARFSPDGTLIASGGNDKLVKLWHVETRQQVALLQAGSAQSDPPQPVLALAVSRDGRSVATAAEDGAIRLRDASSGEVRRTLTGHGDAVLALDFSPDGRWLASAGYDLTVRLWDVAGGTQHRVYEGHDQWVYAVAFSPDGDEVASSDFGGSIHMWNVEHANAVRRFEGHRGPVRALAFTPDGAR